MSLYKVQLHIYGTVGRNMKTKHRQCQASHASLCHLIFMVCDDSKQETQLCSSSPCLCLFLYLRRGQLKHSGLGSAVSESVQN